MALHGYRVYTDLIPSSFFCIYSLYMGMFPADAGSGGPSALRLAQGIVHYPKMIASSPLTSALYLLLIERHNSRAISRTMRSMPGGDGGSDRGMRWAECTEQLDRKPDQSEQQQIIAAVDNVSFNHRAEQEIHKPGR
jgi:hypothetical protein